MMVMLPLMQEKVNLLCSQSSLVSQILTPGAHLSRETFWEDSQLRLPKYLAHSQEETLPE